MNKVQIYRVTVFSTAIGCNWVYTFIGRPTEAEVLRQLEQSLQDTLAEVLDDVMVAAEVINARCNDIEVRFTHYRNLLEVCGLPHKGATKSQTSGVTCKCFGVEVGHIEVARTTLWGTTK